jgi:Asp-tRNA(Asn)/Glu-tRNA(Gln) amidotransferase A subunit family amidase
MLTRLTSIFDFAGLPAISVPVGEHDGLPIGLQVVARPGADHVAAAVGQAIHERATITP